jgi:FAD/FMN-containing dehydrogenase
MPTASGAPPQVDEPSLARALEAIVGTRGLLRQRSELAVYTADGLPGYRKFPSLAVFPANRAQLVDVVIALAEHGAPFVPRGAGTGLSGGALADGVVLVGLNRLRRILSLDPDNAVAVVEPGVVNAALSRAAAPFGLYYAPDPSSQAACTIGGNVAENAGGRTVSSTVSRSTTSSASRPC